MWELLKRWVVDILFLRHRRADSSWIIFCYPTNIHLKIWWCVNSTSASLATYCLWSIYPFWVSRGSINIVPPEMRCYICHCNFNRDKKLIIHILSTSLVCLFCFKQNNSTRFLKEACLYLWKGWAIWVSKLNFKLMGNWTTPDSSRALSSLPTFSNTDFNLASQYPQNSTAVINHLSRDKTSSFYFETLSSFWPCVIF